MRKSVILFILFLSMAACSNKDSATEQWATANLKDYESLTTIENDSMPEGYNYTLLIDRKNKEEYNKQPADYQFRAWQVSRSSGGENIGVLISFYMDRFQTSLLGNPGRKTERAYHFIPSKESDPQLIDKYQYRIKDMGYKDFEVFTSNLSLLVRQIVQE